MSPKELFSLIAFLFVLLFPFHSFGQGLITGIDSNVTFQGTIGESPVKLEIEINMAGSGDFIGRFCGVYDLQEFGDIPDIWRSIKGHFNNETQEMTFNAYFYDDTKPFASFTGVWGETSDGEGIFGEFKTLSIDQIEDVYLYEPE